MKKTLIPLIFAMMISTVTQAAFITIDEAGMNGVFSQATFGANTVDIRIGAITEIIRPDLLDIQTDPQINTLFGLHIGAVNIVNFYFVDVVDSCSGFNTAIVGCGEFPGNDFVVESPFANTSFNTELLSHELGHNLGLAHRSGLGNLMDGTINNGLDLNAAEVATILASPLIQFDSGQRFIQINPVLIVAAGANVPEPAIFLLMLMGFGLLLAKKRKELEPFSEKILVGV